MKVETWRDGDILCHEGAEAEELFVIRQGEVSILRDDIVLASRRADDVIGEQAFIEGTTRGATVRAHGMVRALIIPRAAVERLLMDPTFARNLLVQVSKKLNQATSDRAWRYQVEHLLFGEFRSQVSREVLQELLNSGEDYGAPRRTDAVILFADIRGFTARSASMEPEEIAAQLTAYLDHAVEAVHDHGGMVDKFVGDAMMAVWGGLVAKGEDLARRAFKCAARLAESAGQFRFGAGPVELGIGLNSGEVFMGIVGGENKRQFTVLGSPVNLAARYQGLSSELAAPLVLGPDFRERLPEDLQATLREHPRCAVKGAGEQTLYTWSPARGYGGTETEQRASHR